MLEGLSSVGEVGGVLQWSVVVAVVWRSPSLSSVAYLLTTNHHTKQLEEVLGQRRYLRQSNVIRQVASPYSLCQRFAYTPFNAMVAKISKWSRIQDSCRIMLKIESLVVYAMPDIPSKFQKDPSITVWVIAWTHRQTNKQTKTGKNITSLAEVIKRHALADCIKADWPVCTKLQY